MEKEGEGIGLRVSYNFVTDGEYASARGRCAVHRGGIWIIGARGVADRAVARIRVPQQCSLCSIVREGQIEVLATYKGLISRNVYYHTVVTGGYAYYFGGRSAGRRYSIRPCGVQSCASQHSPPFHASRPSLIRKQTMASEAAESTHQVPKAS